MSAWELPTTVEVAGHSFAIRSDFRAVLDALAALTDPDLTQQEHYLAWNRVACAEPDFHRPEFFGELVFA